MILLHTASSLVQFYEATQRICSNVTFPRAVGESLKFLARIEMQSSPREEFARSSMQGGPAPKSMATDVPL